MYTYVLVMIAIIILAPFINAIIIEFLTSGERIKRVSLATSILVLALNTILWLRIDHSANFYHSERLFLLDPIALLFLSINSIIFPIIFLAGWRYSGRKAFYSLFSILQGVLELAFSVNNLLMFYVFFETLLVPVYLIIILFGSGKYRTRAAMLIFLYTIFGSLFMLISVLMIYHLVGTTHFVILETIRIEKGVQSWLWWGFFIGLAVKTPIVPFHIWLPKAHSEAPLSGSIALAAVILKLATYGYIRIMLTILPEATIYFNPIIYTLALISILYTSFVTIRQVDFKELIAYSSVAHMGIATLGLFSNNFQGILGALLLSFAHGFTSPALFILLGGFLYQRFHTRVIRYYRGMTTFMPLFSTAFFISILANIGTPLTINWIGELLAISGAFVRNPIVATISTCSLLLTLAYSIWIYNRIAFGEFSNYLTKPSDLDRLEAMTIAPLLIFVILFGIGPNPVIDLLSASVSRIIVT